MSREVSKGEEAGWALFRFLWGTAQTLVLLTLAGLLVEHMKRKIDAGLVHWPGAPDRKLYLGVPPGTTGSGNMPTRPPPGTPAPQVPGPYTPPAPVPGVDWTGGYTPPATGPGVPGVVNLGGLLGMNRQ